VSATGAGQVAEIAVAYDEFVNAAPSACVVAGLDAGGRRSGWTANAPSEEGNPSGSPVRSAPSPKAGVQFDLGNRQGTEDGSR
jgi:hypothetical protein